ncbi:SDR family NAD(P)-dependent oxidoreductase [Streptomyces sp. NPDC006235]|uniref:SDR family NAD(P)-dependent oxidoreductase n=1 Tax=Streptomyces sp. NPDC006235 TaxID=3156736 RepID=UPI0033B726B2
MKRPGCGGGASGIGRAIAGGLARRGASVVLHGRDGSRGDAVVQAIQADGGVARCVAADLADSDQVQQLAAGVGDVDILVHSAGIYEFVPATHTDAASFDRQVAVNMRAPFLPVEGPVAKFGGTRPCSMGRTREGALGTRRNRRCRLPSPRTFEQLRQRCGPRCRWRRAQRRTTVPFIAPRP